MAAGIATLTQLQAPGFYDALERKSQRLETGLRDAVGRASVKARVSRVGSMIGLFFSDRQVNNYADAKTSDLNLYARFYKGMLEQGIYLAPSQFETWFVSIAHSEDDIDQTVEAAYNVLNGIKEWVNP
jgi:glutamate-1-semialdehyde 2,1-aminomutase